MIEFNDNLIKKLVTEQFPEFAHLEIKAVEFGGHDNRTFHLGNEMLVRLPSAEDYALKVEKEQKYLRRLAPHLSLPIPTPIKKGKPSEHYPWEWSIYSWLDGKSANCLSPDELDYNEIARQLAQFLNELHLIDTRDAASPGLHNFWRGAHPSVYGDDTIAYIKELSSIIDAKRATALWERAISSKWEKFPVWIHGDLASGNILVKDKKLSAVIDFGGTGIGDPACDLVIAWVFLKDESRKIFKENLDLDEDTWARARGWALWKACFELMDLKDKNGNAAKKHLQIINDVLNETDKEL